MRTSPLIYAALLASTLFSHATALDNGFLVPPMGWSTWYGFTSHINETMLRDTAAGMVQSGLHAAGFEHLWLDDGWAVGRHPNGTIIEDPQLFPSGLPALIADLHTMGLKFGIYTSKGNTTCLGRPGAYNYETIDARTYAAWGVDAVKDDGCGAIGAHDPWTTMRDALNATGRPMWFAIHSTTTPGSPNATVANMWRTGGDLSAASYAMWTNRLDLATTPEQRALAGPGAFPNPDFLEVGYSPRNPKGGNVQTVTERRSMFTMWAALPGPLMLSADLRPGRGGLDADVLGILTNREVIAVNQDPLGAPMAPVWRAGGLEVWRKPLSADKGEALIMFYRNSSGAAPAALNHTPARASPAAGWAVTLAPCDPASAASQAFDMPATVGRIALRSDRRLCLGLVGEASCAFAPFNRTVGLVACDAADDTQLWSGLPASSPANPPLVRHMDPRDPQPFDLNAGPQCTGAAHRSMLLFPVQNHTNELFSYSPSSGAITQGGSCLTAMSPPPPPPPPPPATRAITVTWAQLGWPSTRSVAVRDLWLRQDLGEHTGSFTATVAFHEAKIFILK